MASPVPSTSSLMPHSATDLCLFAGTLFPHQREALDFLLDRPHAILGLDVGLGKCVTACALVAALRQRGEICSGGNRGRVLFVVPASTILQVRTEVATFLPSFSVADSSTKITVPSRRRRTRHIRPLEDALALRDNPPDIEIVSPEFLTSRRDDYKRRGPWGLVVLDELATLKGSGKEPRGIAQVVERAHRVVGMSASLVENDLTELFRMMRLVRVPGLWSERVFNGRFVVFDDGVDLADGRSIPPKPIGVQEQNLPELRSYLQRNCLQRSAADVGVRLPDLEREIIWVSPTAAQAQALRDGRQLFGLDGHRVRETAVSFAGPQGQEQSASALAAVAWLVEHPNHRKVIAWADRLAHLDVMARALDGAGLSYTRLEGKTAKLARASALADFRSDDTRVLLASSVLERGLNIQVADVLLSLGSTWNPARERQREGRIRRIGSPHEIVHHVTFLLNDPHEYGKMKTLLAKEADGYAVLGFPSSSAA